MGGRLVAAAVAPAHDAVRRRSTSQEPTWVTIDADAASTSARIESYRLPSTLRRRGRLGILSGQLHPYDSGTAVLLGGAWGLLAVIALDTLVGLRHGSLLRAVYDATRTTATISSPEVTDEAGTLLWAALAAILVMGFTAAFSAGIVHHLISGRHVALVGRRVVPRSGHVVIAGMGQVGVRLAQELRTLGVAAVGIEKAAHAPALAIARDLSIPVIIGDATSRRVLRRAGLSRAIALVAAASDERDNIAVAISALGTAPDARVVLRAGADDAIDETRSLFHIGSAIDVNGLTSAFVAQAMSDEAPYAVIEVDGDVLAIDTGGAVSSVTTGGDMRCSCSE